MSDHSLLSPSAAHCWVHCSASVLARKGIPATTSGYAEEGTLAHELAATWLRDGVKLPVDESKEMTAAVLTYVENVRALSSGCAESWVEQGLDLSSVLGVPDSMGTADAIALFDSGLLQVHDLKYGKGVEVEVEGNLQMIIYALGAIEIAELAGIEVEVIECYIHQPRLHAEPSKMVLSRGEIEAYKEGIQAAAALAMRIYTGEVEPVYNPGEKQCRFCPAKSKCDALKSFSLVQISAEIDSIDAPEAMGQAIEAAIAKIPAQPLEQKAAVVLNLKLISQWADALYESVMSDMLRGVQYPGLKLVAGRARNRQWANDDAAEAMLKSMRFKIEEMYNLKLISPTQAEKLVKDSPRRLSRMQSLVTRSEPKPAIVAESDKRPAIDINAVVDEIENLNTQDAQDLCA